MSLNIQMAIKRDILIIRLRGELDQAVTENLKVRVSEVIDKYYIKNLILNLKNCNLWIAVE